MKKKLSFQTRLAKKIFVLAALSAIIINSTFATISWPFPPTGETPGGKFGEFAPVFHFLHPDATENMLGIDVDPPTEKLDVNGNIKSAGIIKINGTGSSYFIGKVGIGTATPANQLDVSGDTYIDGSLTVTGTSTLNTLKINATSLSSPENGAFNIQTWETADGVPQNRLTVTADGKVGIGNIIPAYTLDITGDVGFTGTLQNGTIPVARVSGLETVATSGSYNDLYDKPAANDLTQTEVDNLRTAKLDDGTTPWDNADNITSGNLSVDNGGTGQASFVDGELLIGNSTDNTLAKATLTGTENELNVTNGNGSIDLSLPDSIHLGVSGKVGRNGDNLVDFSTDNTISFRTNSIDNQVVIDSSGNINANGTIEAAGTIKATGGLVIENRTDEPTSPVDGQIWLRTDI